ncbi:MAG: DNA-packaging protein [Defluviitaleaceae bacterium]|nr:DNA-packaging protein [Defluviitaleaceae bacterium]
MLLEQARDILRISNKYFDDEIQGLIDACEDDLRLVGINQIRHDDPLIKRAIFTYVKAHFGYEDPNNRFLRDYTMQKLSLRDSAQYRAKK